MNIFKSNALIKQELVSKFERIRTYNCNKLTTSALQGMIERSFTKEEKKGLYKNTLKKYMNDLNNLNEWNQYSRQNKQDSL